MKNAKALIRKDTINDNIQEPRFDRPTHMPTKGAGGAGDRGHGRWSGNQCGEVSNKARRPRRASDEKPR